MNIGDVTITTMVERHNETTIDFLSNASEEAVARHCDWLQPWALDDRGRLRFVIQALCVQSDGRKILVDTCIGARRLPGPYASLADDGSFLDALTAVGFGPDDVDLVVCTHLHFDHVGWNTIRDGDRWVPTFRNARYLVTRPEYEHWAAASGPDREGAVVLTFDDAVAPLAEAGVLDLVATTHQVTDDIRLVPTPGHSAGHVSVRVASRGRTALITGDCAHHPVQLAEPDWCTAADLDAATAAATRRRLVEEYADTDTLIIGTHFPPPSAGHLVTEAGRVRFRPVR